MTILYPILNLFFLKKRDTNYFRVKQLKMKSFLQTNFKKKQWIIKICTNVSQFQIKFTVMEFQFHRLNYRNT